MAAPRLFIPYTDMPERLPPAAWRGIRWAGLAVTAGLVASCFLLPELGLRLFWGAFVPIAPLIFLAMPGIWRNVCPMASLNQLPRTAGFTRGLTIPLSVQRFTPLVSAGLFLLLVPLRRVLLDRSGVALGIFLVSVLTLAFVGGTIFKGKSGWCSQFCPMLQVERFYGQSPLLVVRNSHCRPCVGCNHNCYDFNPTGAYLADLHDPIPRIGVNRKLFAGLMPWLIVAFFTQPYLDHATALSVAALYGRVLVFVLAGIGTFLFLENVGGLSAARVALLHVAAAISLYYFFVAPLTLARWGLPGQPVGAVVTVAVVLVAGLWLIRAWPRERVFEETVTAAPARVGDNVIKAHAAESAGRSEVTFAAGPTVLATEGVTLLELAENNNVPIEAGCRMGMCGADPIVVVSGGENLSPVTSNEQATLERLGKPAGCRMACSARVAGGAVKVSTDPAAEPEKPAGPSDAPATAPAFTPDPAVKRVVVVGAGAAGVTAAQEARKLAPEAEVTLLGFEDYDFYNRMGISKLISESTSVEKLYLLPHDWPAAKGVRFLRGVGAASLDRQRRLVVTGEGEEILYDRLVLATGARSARPRLEGFGKPGSFVLRTIDDAVQVQQYIRSRRVRRAVVVGGGLLGLEAAHAISQLGALVTVLDRGEWPLNRQLDRPSGELVRLMLAQLGIEVLRATSAKRLLGEAEVEGVELTDGQHLQAGICVVAAGIEPVMELGRSAGLSVKRGVVVDVRMATSDPAIYAVGDVAELDGRSLGLWPAAVEQARVAVVNALGGRAFFNAVNPATRLKIPSVDVLSIGTVAAERPEDREIIIEEVETRRYRKLVVRSGQLVGAIMIGRSELFDDVIGAVDTAIDVSGDLERLQAGDWSSLKPKAAPRTVMMRGASR